MVMEKVSLLELRDRKNCPMRHPSGNCTVAGGFCTAVSDWLCDALHCAYDKGEYHALLKMKERKEDKE